MGLLLVGWGVLLITLLGIGGFFMFRKFLKQLPKTDGKSIMDWELHYLNQTKHMWKEEEKDLLNELVSPVPELFRDVAKQSIASKIGEVALKKRKNIIDQDVLVEGYILATPKRDHKFLRKKLKEKEIDVKPYEYLFHLSKKDYADNWEEKYKKGLYVK
ncbi:DUF2621 family protein [Virgibacillus sp. SK37]|uniref:DUF2621 family protein n=1 Tax=Virgibacillus sp. SK37 TaxID=403957 RepID=UPI0011A17444|nr:DUF2621 family protein [Virgibacillus sp. SK37]